MIFRELTRLSISNQLRFIQNLAVGLGNHPFIAQVCLQLENKVEEDGDIDSLCKVLEHIGLHKESTVSQTDTNSKYTKENIKLKSIVIQNNVDIQLNLHQKWIQRV